MSNKFDVKIDTSAVKDTILNFIVPLVCFGVSAGLVFFIIYPSIQKTPQLKSDLQTKTALRTQLETKVGILNKLTDYKSVIEEDLKLMDRILVSDDNVPYLLNQIDTISRNAGFELTKLNYGLGGSTEDASGDTGAEYIAVNLGVNGTYEQLIRFLQNMEKAARLVNVSNFRYALSSSDVNDPVLGMSFLIYSPYLQVNSAATTDDPIQIDITDPAFVSILNYIKEFTFYENMPPSAEISAEEKPIEEIEAPVEEPTEEAVEESTVPEVEETTPTPTE
jgi:Tfp pilus assembly protein PilO